jgi:hypothetical protein
VGTARRRRRRTRVGIAVGCLVAVAAVAGGLALRSDGGPVQVAAGLRQDASTVPDGWTELNVRDAGIRLAIPPDWTQLERYTPSRPAPIGAVPTTSGEAVVVGTSSLPRAGVIAACTDVGGRIPDVPGTWLSLFEYEGYQPGSDILLPLGDGLPVGSIIDRPADFRTLAVPLRGACNAASGSARGPATSAVFQLVAFRDAGRLFLARVVTTPDPNTNDLGIAAEILNTLRVDPATTETPSTTAVTTPTRPVVEPTSAPPPTMPSSVASTPDEAAVHDVFLSWIDAQPKSALDDVVEDFPSIRDAHEQGVAQHSAADLAKYSGRVDSVQIVDDAHANVVYSILFNGAPQFAYRPGEAIKIDGVWKVSRDTVCDLLEVGGIPCPPREGV